MFLPAEVQKEIPEDLRDRWIDSLQKMILGSNNNERYSGLQALSIFARYSEQTNFYPSSPYLTLTKGEMRKKILEAEVTSHLVKLFQSDNDAVKYCASRALIALDGDGILVFILSHWPYSCLNQTIHKLVLMRKISSFG